MCTKGTAISATRQARCRVSLVFYFHRALSVLYQKKVSTLFNSAPLAL